ncbi:universal stress protein [Arcanobacterium bovis]|uniref:Universal stress protein n=1 Tax=Arcanobacterium bovis TaxID=2529275 RepID=A0A4Q9V2D5_9ACTO|nr:universal stress protein [Arcanobacterium bovis]TBW23805.1 universal stress protein [Arcanobacterium bovis]
MAHDNVVVVGVDGSEPSISALKWALEQARKRDAELRLVCVYELPSYAAHTIATGRIAEEGQHLYAAAEKMITSMVKSVEGQGVKVSWELVDGDPSEVLVEMSKKVALIVVGGTSSRSGRIADRLLRTVSTAVPSYACCPTVVVPHVAEGGSLPIKHVVVGVDGSEHAKKALQRAVWEADRWGGKLSIVCSVNVDAVSWVPQFSLDDDFYEEIAANVEEQLAEVDEGRDIDVEVHVMQGNPVVLLSEFSKEADLLVLGTRGRGGFKGLLLGSTSQAILEHSACPTMVVPRRVREGDDVGPAYSPAVV